MNRSRSITLVSCASLLVFIAGAVLTTPALADGSTPPPGNTSSSTRSSTAPLPSGTSLVVLDNTGHKVPLGSQQAIQSIATGDPVWCPSTLAAPTPGANGCTSPGPLNSNYNPDALDSLVGYLAGHQKAVNGTIWITGGADGSTGTISLSASTFNVMSLYALTLKGGWNGTSGSSTIIPASPSTFSQGIEILNWENNISLSDMAISGTSSTGLTISTTHAIALKRVQSNSNLGDGADLDNSSGSGSVTISNSTFSSNNFFLGWGLSILSNGAVTLTGVQAQNNVIGAAIDNRGAAAQPVTINGSSVFSSNGSDGLDVNSFGTISVSSLTASNNAGIGASLDNCNYVSGCTTPGAKSVILAGRNLFESNTGGAGLQIASRGAISVAGLNADGNHGTGAALDNSHATTAEPITLTGYGSFLNSFDNNYNDGLDVTSNGAIAVNHVYASQNTAGTGVALTNGNPGFTGGVSLTGDNFFISNFMDGLDINSNGSILAYNIYSSQNSLAGAVLTNNHAGSTAGVTVAGSNSIGGNTGGDGLDVFSNGGIKVSNLTSDVNGQIGAKLQNDSGTAGVTIGGLNDFEDNQLQGLQVLSKGSISAGNLTVTGNDISGTPSTPGAQLDNSGGTGGVTLSGTNIFDHNEDSGLEITSHGAVLLYNILADVNSGLGAKVDNSTSSLEPSVTLAGTNEFNYNTAGGLEVFSRGVISAHNITASHNSNGFGAELDNLASGTSTPQKVIVSGVNAFLHNNQFGLAVISYGAITASNLTADNNGTTSYATGVTLDNCNFNIITLVCDTVTPQPIILSGTSVFNGNNGQGLDIRSKGSISIHSVTADDNGNSGDGVLLKNDYSSASGGVTVSGTNLFDGNANNGLEIASNGSASVYKVTADNNGLNGLLVTAGGKITVECGSFLYNGNDGLNLTAPGTISLISVFAYGNPTVNISTSHTPVTVRTCPLP